MSAANLAISTGQEIIATRRPQTLQAITTPRVTQSATARSAVHGLPTARGGAVGQYGPPNVVLGIAAVGAGQAFVWTRAVVCSASTAWLDGSPFADYRVPGLFLAIVIGGTNLASAVLLWQDRRVAAWASFLRGLLLVAWVTVQAAILGGTRAS